MVANENSELLALLTHANKLRLVYESFINDANRRSSGIYYTPESYVDFICRLAVGLYLCKNYEFDSKQIFSLICTLPDSEACQVAFKRSEIYAISKILEDLRILDPACGSGAFLVGMLRVLSRIHKRCSAWEKKPFNEVAINRRIVERNLFGMDVKPWAVALAEFYLWQNIYYSSAQLPELSILEYSLPNLQNQLFVGDTLAIRNNSVLQPRSFDIILGNPPYVRHEDIIPHQGNSSTFASNSYKTLITENLATIWGNDFVQDLRSDLYVYFFYRSLDLLKAKGVLAFLTSNSWLNCQYGLPLQKFLLQNARLLALIENQQNRTFSKPSINIVVTLLQRTEKTEAKDNFVRFLTSQVPFSKLLTPNSLQTIFQTSEIVTNNQFRCLPIPQHKLEKEKPFQQSPDAKSYTKDYSRSNWGGVFLRAPNTYLSLLENPPPSLRTFNDFGTIHRGFTTGANAFFYVSAVKCQGHLWTVRNGFNKVFKIEKKYVYPIIKSPNDISSLNLDEIEFTQFILLFPARLPVDSWASKYVQWGERAYARIKKGTKIGHKIKGIHSLKTFQHREDWYSLSSWGKTHFVIPKAPWQRHFVAYGPMGVLVDQRLYGLYDVDPRVDFELLVAAMNCSLTFLSFEINGRTNLGQGVLDLAASDISRSFIIDPDSLNNERKRDLRIASHALREKPLGSIAEELEGVHRKTIDTILMEHIGLGMTEIEEIRERLYQLVKQRRWKAWSVRA